MEEVMKKLGVFGLIRITSYNVCYTKLLRVFLAKTHESLFEELKACVLKMHPYEVHRCMRVIFPGITRLNLKLISLKNLFVYYS